MSSLKELRHMKNTASEEKSFNSRKSISTLLVVNLVVIALITFSFILREDQEVNPPEVLSVEDFSTSTASQNTIPLSYPLTTIGDETPLFDWNPVSYPDLQSYQLYLNNNLISTVPQTQSEYQYIGQGLNGQHTWRVNAIKADNTILASSNTQSFTVQKTTNLSLISPVNNFVTDSMRPFFKWTSSFVANSYQIYLNSVLYAVVQNNVNNEYLAPTNLSPGEYDWYVTAYYVGLGSSGVPISTEIGKSATNKFEIEAIYNLTLRVSIDDDSLIEIDEEDPTYSELGIDVRFIWTKGGTEPPQGSYYRLGINDRESETLLFVDEIPITLETYTLKNEELKVFSANEIYEAKIELIAPDKSVLDSRRATLLYTYTPDESNVLVPIGDDNIIEDDTNVINILGLIIIPLPKSGEELILLTPAFVSVILLLITSLLSLHNIPGLLIEKLVDKRKIYWGIIYDEKDSTPIPFTKVQLIDKANNLVEEVESDVKGRYMFTLQAPGTYKVQVQLTNYKSSSDEVKIDKPGEEIIGDIRMKRIAEDKGLKLTVDQSLGIIFRWINFILGILMLLGLLYTIAAIANNPNIAAFIIFILYAGFIALNSVIFYKLYLNTRVRGKVVDIETSDPVPGVVTRFYNQTGLNSIAISNIKGEIKTNITKGNYKLRINKPGYEFTQDTNNNAITGLNTVFINENGKLTVPIKIKKIIESQEGDLRSPFTGK